jgi:hypothetical protein
MKPPSVPTDPDALVVAVGPGGCTGKYLQVRISYDAAPELHQRLQEEDILAGSSVQASATIPELVALTASIAGGLHGLASVLRAIFERHQHRAVLVERDGTIYELKGMSPAEIDALIARVLEEAEQRQSETEHLYRRIPGADDDLPPLNGQ